MVRGVEGLEAELQVSAFRKVEVLEQRSVPLNQSRPDHHITPGRAERAERLQLKRSGIEPLVGRALVALEVGFADQVGAIETGADVRAIGSCHHGQREASLNRQQGAKLPSAQHGVRDSALIEPPAAFAEWQLKQPGTDKAMLVVEARERFFSRQVVTVLREERVAVVTANRAGVVNRTRPRVAGQECEPSAEAFFKLQTETVVGRPAAAVHFLNAPELGIRRAG